MNDQLLIRYINHRCTPEEIEQIEQWITEDKQNAAHLFEMERLWSVKNEMFFSDEREIESAYTQLMTKVHKKNRMRYLLSWGKYAAVFAVILLLSANLYKMKQWNSASDMNIIEVPKGELVSLTLSDGTKVWLNADTRFSYPSHFMTKKREVIIEGEGYFEVTPNKKPFIVKGDLFNVKVLGTEFNIKAHKDEDAEISLKNGKIEVNRQGVEEEQLVMNPNEQICYTKDGRTVFTQKDMSNINRWSKGEIAFYSQPLSVIAKTLERKYNVSITLENSELEKIVFTCRTKPGASLKEVLELLKETQLIEYTYNNQNNIIITKK